MHMPRHLRRLLVLAMLCSVAPVSAEGLAAPVAYESQSSDCPYERARAAAEEQRAIAAAAAITSSEAVPADGSLFSRQTRDFLP
jgi:hypothetical protein